VVAFDRIARTERTLQVFRHAHRDCRSTTASREAVQRDIALRELRERFHTYFDQALAALWQLCTSSPPINWPGRRQSAKACDLAHHSARQSPRPRFSSCRSRQRHCFVHLPRHQALNQIPQPSDVRRVDIVRPASIITPAPARHPGVPTARSSSFEPVERSLVGHRFVDHLP
jgi:hypothetical protein